MHVQRWWANSVERLWLRQALLVLAVACVLLVPLGNPGSGTAVNLHRAEDAAAVVRGDHHAKTMPSAPTIVAILVAVGVAVGLARRPMPALALPRWSRLEAIDQRHPAGLRPVFGRAAAARRGPPALV